jgi:CheY-like chemotaxis protein
VDGADVGVVELSVVRQGWEQVAARQEEASFLMPRCTDAMPEPARILVIEDNPDGREALRMLLGLLGFRVETASDGQRGVEKALAWHPDAAVVDIGLPILDGFEVARRIRARLGTDVFLVALSAYSTDEFRDRGLASGFDLYLTKPTDPRSLYRLLAAGIADRHALPTFAKP